MTKLRTNADNANADITGVTAGVGLTGGASATSINYHISGVEIV
jgi:hypothetical protein